MGKMHKYERALRDWANAWKKENITPETNKLINQAYYSLMYGPALAEDVEDETSDWHGWKGDVSAWSAIRDALDNANLPRVLYIDDQSDFVSTSAPEVEECATCDGEGTVGDDDATHEQVREERCPDCNGQGCFDVSGDWYKLEYREILNAIVGKELAEYVR